MSIDGTIIGLIAGGGTALALLGICTCIYCYRHQRLVGGKEAFALPFRPQPRTPSVQIDVAGSPSKFMEGQINAEKVNDTTNVVGVQAGNQSPVRFARRIIATGRERPGFQWLQSKMNELMPTGHSDLSPQANNYSAERERPGFRWIQSKMEEHEASARSSVKFADDD